MSNGRKSYGQRKWRRACWVSIPAKKESCSDILFLPHSHFAVVDAHSTWCGPCKAIVPSFQKVFLEKADDYPLKFCVVRRHVCTMLLFWPFLIHFAQYTIYRCSRSMQRGSWHLFKRQDRVPTPMKTVIWMTTQDERSTRSTWNRLQENHSPISCSTWLVLVRKDSHIAYFVLYMALFSSISRTGRSRGRLSEWTHHSLSKWCITTWRKSTMTT